MSEQGWTFAGEESAVTEDEPLSVKVGETMVGVYSLNGHIHALEDVCPHADALLSQGFIDGEYVECPLHGALFHIPTGKCTKGPAERDLALFETKIENGKILLRQQPKGD
jgi:3-phenylpropionate/trans-cinnamate dioxygenase ferredoxin subunit